jgi:hypothetical protein
VFDIDDIGEVLSGPLAWRELLSKHTSVRQLKIRASRSFNVMSRILSILDPAVHTPLLLPQLHTLDVFGWNFRNDTNPLVRYLQARKRVDSPVKRLELQCCHNLDDDMLAKLQLCVDHVEFNDAYSIVDETESYSD